MKLGLLLQDGLGDSHLGREADSRMTRPVLFCLHPHDCVHSSADTLGVPSMVEVQLSVVDLRCQAFCFLRSSDKCLFEHSRALDEESRLRIAPVFIRCGNSATFRGIIFLIFCLCWLVG